MPKKSEVTLLRNYLKERHQEVFGIEYVCNNHAAEGRMIKTFVNQYGIDVAERFIDACFKDYTPNARYPGINFGFIYSYMRERILPRVLAEIAKEQHRSEPVEQEMSQEDFEDFI